MTSTIERLRQKARMLDPLGAQLREGTGSIVLWFYFQNGHDETQRALRGMQSILAQLLRHRVFNSDSKLMEQAMEIIDKCSSSMKTETQNRNTRAGTSKNEYPAEAEGEEGGADIATGAGKIRTSRGEGKMEALKSCETLTTVIALVAALLKSLIFIVVDAVDECIDHEEKRLFPNLRRLANSNSSGAIRILVSARNTLNVDAFLGFKEKPKSEPLEEEDNTKPSADGTVVTKESSDAVASGSAVTNQPPYIRKIEVNKDTNEGDIELYLMYKVETLVSRRMKGDMEENRKSESFTRLVKKILTNIKEKAKGDFAFATLVVASLEEPSRFSLEQRLEKLPDQMSGMYMKSLKLLTEEQRELVIMALTRIVWAEATSKISATEIAEQYKDVYNSSWYARKGDVATPTKDKVEDESEGQKIPKHRVMTLDPEIEGEIAAEIEDTKYQLRRCGRDFLFFEGSENSKDYLSVVDIQSAVRDWVRSEAEKTLKVQTESRPINSLFKVDGLGNLSINLPIAAIPGARDSWERFPSAREAHLEILIYCLKTICQPRFQEKYMPYNPPQPQPKLPSTETSPDDEETIPTVTEDAEAGEAKNGTENATMDMNDKGMEADKVDSARYVDEVGPAHESNDKLGVEKKDPSHNSPDLPSLEAPYATDAKIETESQGDKSMAKEDVEEVHESSGDRENSTENKDAFEQDALERGETETKADPEQAPGPSETKESEFEEETSGDKDIPPKYAKPEEKNKVQPENSDVNVSEDTRRDAEDSTETQKGDKQLDEEEETQGENMNQDQDIESQATLEYAWSSDIFYDTDAEDEGNAGPRDETFTESSEGPENRYELFCWWHHMKELENSWPWSESNAERNLHDEKWKELFEAFAEFVKPENFERWRVQYHRDVGGVEDYDIYHETKYKTLTPLRVAVWYGGITLIQYMVEQHGADVNLNRMGLAPIHICGLYPVITKYLLEHGAEVDAMMIPEEIEERIHQDGGVVTPLVAHLLKICYIDYIPVSDREKYTQSCKYLIQRGANVRFAAPDRYYCVEPIHLVPYCLDLEILEMVLSRIPGDVNKADGWGRTPLHHCFRSRDTKSDDGTHEIYAKIAKVLIEKGADVDAQAKYSMAPLAYAVLDMNIHGVRILIEHNADLYDDDEFGFTAFAEACGETIKLDEATEIVRLLIDKDEAIKKAKQLENESHHETHELQLPVADDKDIGLNLTTSAGLTALSLAVKSKNFKLVKFLLETYRRKYGPEKCREWILQKDNRKRSSLFRAARHFEGGTDIAELITADLSTEQLRSLLESKASSRERRVIQKACLTRNKDMILCVLRLCARVEPALEAAQARSAFQWLRTCYLKTATVGENRRGPTFGAKVKQYKDCLLAMMKQYPEMAKGDFELFSHVHISNTADSKEIVQQFMDIGMSPDARDEYGWSVFDLAEAFHISDQLRKLYPTFDISKVNAESSILGPSRWFNKYKDKDMRISEDGLKVWLDEEAEEGDPPWPNGCRCCMIVANQPMRPENPDFPRSYFEVTIEDISMVGAVGGISVGVLRHEKLSVGMLGLAGGGIGYHSFWGVAAVSPSDQVYFKNLTGKDCLQAISISSDETHTACSPGDTFGVGYDMKEKVIFCTKNGKFDRIAARNVVGRWFPCVGTTFHKGYLTRVNFGAQEFLYRDWDLDIPAALKDPDDMKPQTPGDNMGNVGS